MKWVIGVSILLSGIAIPAHAELGSPLTGNDLFQYCGTELTPGAQPTYQTGVCHGFIIGTAESMQSGGVTCQSPTVTNGQLIDVVVQYIALHPEIRDRPALLLTVRALHDAFPCPKQD
jgi:hypothetical protein